MPRGTARRNSHADLLKQLRPILQGHPREPGEVLVASFDPDEYLNVAGAESLKTLPVIPSK